MPLTECLHTLPALLLTITGQCETQVKEHKVLTEGSAAQSRLRQGTRCRA
jgi:hypothetical protein